MDGGLFVFSSPPDLNKEAVFVIGIAANYPIPGIHLPSVRKLADQLFVTVDQG